jgi:hypothetical protein
MDNQQGEAMRFFGKPWGPAVDDRKLMLQTTPVGMHCFHCNEMIAADDSGVVMQWFDADSASSIAFHRECQLRNVFGSVGHQLKRCTCFGGTDEDDDPVGMTPRQAAVAAVELFEAGIDQFGRNQQMGKA